MGIEGKWEMFCSVSFALSSLAVFEENVEEDSVSIGSNREENDWLGSTGDLSLGLRLFPLLGFFFSCCKPYSDLVILLLKIFFV